MTHAETKSQKIFIKVLVEVSRFFSYPYIYLNSDLRTKYKLHAIFFLTRISAYGLSALILIIGLESHRIFVSSISIVLAFCLLHLRQIKKINFLLSTAAIGFQIILLAIYL